MSVNRDCECTKCKQEFNATLPNNHAIWLDDILCDDCFDEWINKRFPRRINE
jgi:hypothetical protein